MPLKSFIYPLFLFPSLCVLSAGQAPADQQGQISLHTRLAQQYLSEKRPELALPELQKVVELDPNNVGARGDLGVLLFFRGDYKDAVPQLRAAINLSPDLWKLRALLGLGEGQLGDSSASQTDLEAAFPHLKGDKFQKEVGEALIDDYTAQEDLEKAATVVSTLLTAQPTDSSLLYLSYRLYSDLAGKSMLTLALVAPDSAEMYQVMARELARQGDNSAAIADYRAAIKLNSRLTGIHTELGDMLFHSQDTKLKSEAAAEFKAALAVNPKDERAELFLGMLEAKQDPRAANADLSRALRLDPNDGDACTELAKVLETLNQPKEAQQLFERAIQIDPTNDVAHYHLATIYRKTGRIDEAKQQVDLYLQYKKMKDKMDKIFHDMRVLSLQQASDDQDCGSQ